MAKKSKKTGDETGDCVTGDLVTAKVAARLLGVQSTSNFRYHVRKGRIRPVKEIWLGRMRIPYYDTDDVRSLRRKSSRTAKKAAAAGRESRRRERSMGRGDGLDGLLRASQVAEKLDVKNVTTVWYHVRKGRLKVERTIKQGDRLVSLFDPTQVKRLAQELNDQRKQKRGDESGPRELTDSMHAGLMGGVDRQSVKRV